MPRTQPFGTMAYVGLNESPSEKEGKLVRMTALILDAVRPQ